MTSLIKFMQISWRRASTRVDARGLIGP